MVFFLFGNISLVRINVKVDLRLEIVRCITCVRMCVFFFEGLFLCIWAYVFEYECVCVCTNYDGFEYMSMFVSEFE